VSKQLGFRLGRYDFDDNPARVADDRWLGGPNGIRNEAHTPAPCGCGRGQVSVLHKRGKNQTGAMIGR
jgi:hypothetical protein